MNRREFLRNSFWAGVAIGVAPAFVRSESLMLLVPAKEIVEVPWKPIIVEHVEALEQMLVWRRDTMNRITAVPGFFKNPPLSQFDKYFEELTWNTVKQRN
jgi:hypothetical protein